MVVEIVSGIFTSCEKRLVVAWAVVFVNSLVCWSLKSVRIFCNFGATGLIRDAWKWDGN